MLNKYKKYFCKSCLHCFSSKIVLNKNKKDCLLRTKGQNIKLEQGFIEFKNFNRQIPVPFKIYADFECLLKDCDVGIDKDCFSYTKKYQDLVVLLIKLCVLIINTVKKFVCIGVKMQLINLSSAFLKNMVIVDL